MGIDPYDVEYKIHECARRLRNRTISRAGNIAARPIFDVRDSMIQTVYQISFVGADDPVRPSKSGDFLRSFVGADAHIGPPKCCEFASDFRKKGYFRGRTGSSAPTVQKGKSTWIRRKSTIKRVLSAGRCRHRPLRSKIETQCNNVRPPPRGGIPVWAVGWVDVGIDPYGAESQFRGFANRQPIRSERVRLWA